MSRSVLAVCLLSSFASVMCASEWDKKTVVTFHEPVIVAGVPVVTLEPGRYVLVLDESSSDRHIVRIFNERRDKLFTTVLAIADYRLEPSGKTTFSFWETPAGNPRALHAWFYPGDNVGQEFVYPKGLAANLARESGSTVVATPAETEAELVTAPLVEITKAGEENPFIEEAFVEAEPATAAAEVAEAEPGPVPELAPLATETLPATASPFYAIGVAGLFSLVLGAGLRRLSRA